MVIIREANIEDVGAIAKVHVNTWRTTYRGIIPEDYLANLSYEKREKGWVQILKNGDVFVYVAIDESGEIVGFACGGKERTGNSIYQGEVQAIYILEAYQGQGIGRRLILAIVERLAMLEIHSMLIWVLTENPAGKFYEAMGGEKVYEQQIQIGGVQLDEVAYGWKDTSII
jgi:GNAT superfamily N-acetyltransferase